MADGITILGIAGSLRKESFNKGVLRAARELCPQGAKLEVYDLAGLPLFNQDEERSPTPKVTEFKQRIRAADAILIATPEYNYSIPGVLKNALDCASRPYGDNAWAGKPVALMSASIGAFGGVRAQYHLRQCFVFLNMDCVLQPEVAIPVASQHFDAQGNLTSDLSRKLIGQLVQALVAKAQAAKQPMRQAA